MAKKPKVPEPSGEIPAESEVRPDGAAPPLPAEQTAGDPGPASPPAVTHSAPSMTTTATAAGSTPAAVDPPAASPETRVFRVAPERTVMHDGEPYLAGETILLTKGQHAPLHAAGAVTEPWGD